MRIWSQMKYSVWTIVLLDAEPEDKHSNLLSHNLLHLPGAKQHINTCTTKQISFHQKPYHDSRAKNHSLKNLTQFDTQSQTRIQDNSKAPTLSVYQNFKQSLITT